MSGPAPEVVTLHVWRVPRRRVLAAVVRMASDRRRVRRVPGIGFAKLLGTADGDTLTPRGADPTRWALVAAWARAGDADWFERSAVSRGWARLAEETCRILMRPLSSRGRWSGRHPFGQPHQPGRTSEPAPTTAGRWDGPVAALTRARLAPLRAVGFWRAVPPVAGQLR
ncbi:MAG TPA: monooxygenase, partial [Mycobacteriales bacterium]|nr:monooxygenase [Mycobacteriales bacterium]